MPSNAHVIVVIFAEFVATARNRKDMVVRLHGKRRTMEFGVHDYNAFRSILTLPVTRVCAAFTRIKAYGVNYANQSRGCSPTMFALPRT